MTPIALVVPGSLQARTGGYIYDRHMVDGLRRLGRRVDVLELDASFPHPTPAALEHADRTLAAIRRRDHHHRRQPRAWRTGGDHHARSCPAAGGGARPSASRRRHRPRARGRRPLRRRRTARARGCGACGRHRPGRAPADRPVLRCLEPDRDRRAWNRSSPAGPRQGGHYGGGRFATGPPRTAHRRNAPSRKGTRATARSAFRDSAFGVAPDVCGQSYPRSRNGHACTDDRRAPSAGGSGLIRRRSRSRCTRRALRAARMSRSSPRSRRRTEWRSPKRWRTGSRSSRR